MHVYINKCINVYTYMEIQKQKYSAVCVIIVRVYNILTSWMYLTSEMIHTKTE